MGKGQRNRHRRHVETHTEKIGNMTVTTWNEDVRFGDMPADLRARRAEYEDELPPMKGYGFRDTNVLTGKVTDFTFETQEDFEKFYVEYYKPENLMARLFEDVFGKAS